MVFRHLCIIGGLALALWKVYRAIQQKKDASQEGGSRILSFEDVNCIVKTTSKLLHVSRD